MESDQSAERSNRYVLGRIPFGPHHERMLGRVLYIYYRATWGFVFAVAMFAVLYWGDWQAINESFRLHLLVFICLWGIGMEGSTYQQDKRAANYVLKRLEGNDDG